MRLESAPPSITLLRLAFFRRQRATCATASFGARPTFATAGYLKCDRARSFTHGRESPPPTSGRDRARCCWPGPVGFRPIDRARSSLSLKVATNFSVWYGLRYRVTRAYRKNEHEGKA